jgi:hypothetical protein
VIDRDTNLRKNQSKTVNLKDKYTEIITWHYAKNAVKFTTTRRWIQRFSYSLYKHRNYTQIIRTLTYGRNESSSSTFKLLQNIYAKQLNSDRKQKLVTM